VLKGFSEHRIISNKVKDNVSRKKNQAFFEIYYNFSNDFQENKDGREREFDDYSGRGGSPPLAPAKRLAEQVSRASATPLSGGFTPATPPPGG
jgi:hypothetical protein